MIFIGFKHEGNKTILDFEQNPKIDELISLLDSVPKNRKAVIFHEYTHTGELINKALKKAGYKSVWLYGGTKDKVATLNQFTEGSVQFLVANTISGGTSLDLQMANYMFIVECNPSPIEYSQMLKRCHRTGQKYPVFVYRLLVNKSVDQKIIGFIEQGKNLFDELVRGTVDPLIRDS